MVGTILYSSVADCWAACCSSLLFDWQKALAQSSSQKQGDEKINGRIDWFQTKQIVVKKLLKMILKKAFYLQLKKACRGAEHSGKIRSSMDSN